MSEARPPQPAKLIAGLLAKNVEWIELAVAEMTKRFGPVDFRSPPVPFESTHYYDGQMGPGLLRQFISFERLIDPSGLADAKLFTNELEARLAEHLRGDVERPVNIDPGYLTEAKLVLASAKNFSHRIYLRDGIYAEITLYYKDNAWQHCSWTFPDYRSEAYHAIFRRIRELLRRQLDRP